MTGKIPAWMDILPEKQSKKRQIQRLAFKSQNDVMMRLGREL